MPIFRKKELGKKMLKTTIKVASNTEDRKVESMQCFSKITILISIGCLLCFLYILYNVH